MPVDYKISADQHLVIVRYFGNLKLDEIMAARLKGATDPDFDPTYNVIDDISEVTASDIDYEMVRKITQQSVVQQGVRRALIAVTDLQRGMANMYKVLSESAGHRFEVFNDFEEGMNWVMTEDEGGR